MGFPEQRLRRLRKSENMRRLVRETQLCIDDLIMPLFVRPGKGIKQLIPSMPGNYQMSVDKLVEDVKTLEGLGIPGIILFGIPDKKDEMGSDAYSDEGIIQKAIIAIKKEAKNILVITDVCNHKDILCLFFNGNNGLLDYPFIGIGIGTHFVLLIRNPEKNNSRNSKPFQDFYLFNQLINRHLVVSRHRWYRLFNAFSRPDKEGHNQVVYRQMRFSDQSSHIFVLT